MQFFLLWFHMLHVACFLYYTLLSHLVIQYYSISSFYLPVAMTHIPVSCCSHVACYCLVSCLVVYCYVWLHVTRFLFNGPCVDWCHLLVAVLLVAVLRVAVLWHLNRDSILLHCSNDIQDVCCLLLCSLLVYMQLGVAFCLPLPALAFCGIHGFTRTLCSC